MLFTKNYFDKENIEEITYTDVVDFFKTEREESDKIEFKSFVTKENEQKSNKKKESVDAVIKSIVGFLNSDGGLLIWGAPEGKKSATKKEKVFTGELKPIDFSFEKDQFISKITDSITPPPKGVLFHRIEHEGKYVYVLEVPKSEYAPHQFKHTFFMRIDGQTKPAPYHYIEALFKKVKFPNLNGFIKFSDWKLHGSNYYLTITVFILNLSKLLNDYNVSYNVFCDLGKFDGFNDEFIELNPHVEYANTGNEIRRINIKDVIYYGQPIFENEHIIINAHDLERNNFKIELIFSFGAKHSPMKACTYTLSVSHQAPKNLNDWIEKKSENQLMGEDKKMNLKELIEKTLGRKI